MLHAAGRVGEVPHQKPYSSKEHKQERKRWCKHEKACLQRKDKKYACFLDKKCFYTTSRGRKIKFLRAAPHKNPGEVQPAVPTTVSRRNVLKVVYLAVVAKPIAEHNFDRKIMRGLPGRRSTSAQQRPNTFMIALH